MIFFISFQDINNLSTPLTNWTFYPLDWVICSQLNLRAISLFLRYKILEKLVIYMWQIFLSKNFSLTILRQKFLIKKFTIKISCRNTLLLRGLAVGGGGLDFHFMTEKPPVKRFVVMVHSPI